MAADIEVAGRGIVAACIPNGLGIGFLSWTILDGIDDDGLVSVPGTAATRPTSAAVRPPLPQIEARA